MIAYKVGDKKFYNNFLALHHAWKTGKLVEFDCYEDTFDRFDWSIEPSSTLYSLMVAHAHLLRSRYERLILLWSGGTDSHTIYNIFKLAKIHLDEIIIKAEKDSESFPEKNHTWLMNNHWDSSTILTKYEDHDTHLRLMDLPNEDWVWRNKGDLLKYGMTSTGDAVRFLCEKNHAGHSWRAIGGYEKPRLVYRKGKWYHRQLACVLEATMGHDHIEHFFLEPMIAIKQSHMVKKAVKDLIKNNNLALYDGDWAEAKWPKSYEGYRNWSNACGRYDELYLGVSHSQKKINEQLFKTEINCDNWKDLKSSVDHRLKEDIQNQNPAALNYIKGFYNLSLETGFVKYLKDNQWFRQNENCFTNLKHIWSKEHCVGV